MAKVAARRVLVTAADERSALTDRELLRRFAADNDQGAFAALVRRHTGLVLGVCRRSLPAAADAEDACQAVFVVLARKAGGRWQPSVANWLYLTARKVSRDARRAAERRVRRERTAAVPEGVAPTDHMTGTELLAALDDELDRLSAVYREPLVLCYLQGLSREEAAARLGVPAGTVKIRLERGRKKLADALTARGVAAGLGLLALAVTSPAGASPPRFFDSVLAAVNGSPTPAAAALARGVTMTGVLTRTKLLAVVGVLAVGFGLAGVAADPPKTADPPKAEGKGEPKPVADEKLTVQVVDADGKPVAGATVYRSASARTQTPTPEAVAGKTDAVGKLVVEWKPLFTFHATADGYCAGASGLLNDPSPATIRLAKPLPIKGRLVDLQGKPVANAKVVIESVAAAENDDLTAAYNAYRVNPEWASGLRAFLRSTDTGAPKGVTTDKDGRFELTGVGKLRVVRLRFEADGIERARAVVFADPEFEKRMKLRSEAERQMTPAVHDLRVATHGPEFTHAARPEHVIVGTVTDAAGKPVAGLKVVGTANESALRTTYYPGWSEKEETTTDKDGKFRLAGLVKAKTRYLHVQGGDTAPYLDQIVEVRDTTGYTPVTADVTLTPAVLVTGRLTNRATGKAVRGMATWLPLEANTPLQQQQTEYAALYTRMISAPVTGTQAAADADGNFTLRVPAGPGVVLARADALDPAAAFAPLRVRDEDRKYVRKRENELDSITGGTPQPRDDEENFATVQRGQFTVGVSRTRLENGYAIIDPDAKAKTVEVTSAFDPGSTVTLNVTDPDGKPVGGVTVIGRSQAVRTPVTFAKPEVAIGGFDPKGKPVQLYLLHKERKLCGGVRVNGDEKGPVAVKLVPCGGVTGTVVDHTGKAVKGAVVTYQMTDYTANDLLKQKLLRGENEVRTDADGKFTFPALFSDVEFGVYASTPGFRSGAAFHGGVVLKPGEAKDVGELKCREPKKSDDK
jgi:RNA polymerase sigma factor (sigma-70 family)